MKLHELVSELILTRELIFVLPVTLWCSYHQSMMGLSLLGIGSFVYAYLDIDEWRFPSRKVRIRDLKYAPVDVRYKKVTGRKEISFMGDDQKGVVFRLLQRGGSHFKYA